MRLHGAHDEVRVARGDVLPVLLLQLLEGFVAVAPAVGEIGRLHFPIVDVAKTGVGVDFP